MAETLIQIAARGLGSIGLIERLDREITKGVSDQILEEIFNPGTFKEPKSEAYIGDDYIPDANFYNALGAIYPILSKEKRAEVLKKIVVERMDGVRYDRVSRNHTPYIRDPQLLSDIGCSRSLYWPGLHDEEALWKEKDFDDVRATIMDENGLFLQDKVNSDFLVAYALLRQEFGEQYAQAAHPEFLKRVTKGIVNLRFVNKDGERNEEKIEKGRKRLLEILPPSLHNQIDQIRQEKDWVVLPGR